MELTDIAKVAALEEKQRIVKDVDRKIAHWEAKLEAIPKIIADLKASKAALVERKVNQRLRQLSKAGITIEVPPAELGLETH